MFGTGHRNVMALRRSYLNLEGDIGIQQLSEMFRMPVNNLHASKSTNIVPVMNKTDNVRKITDTKEETNGNIGNKISCVTEKSCEINS